MQNKTAGSAVAPDAQPLLSPKEVARLLGVTEHTLAVWRCTQRYDLPFVKIGSRVRYRAADVAALLNAGTTA